MPNLDGKRLLIVEDEFLLAEELRHALDRAGAEVVGQTADLDHALDLAASEGTVDAAILDINLNGDMAYPLADLLAEREIPFVFVSGYDASFLPDRFRDVPRFGKPLDIEALMSALSSR